jgi:hypothetical protein
MSNFARVARRDLRRKATHTLTAKRTTISDASYDSPPTETETEVVSGEDVRLLTSGTDLQRTETGERIAEAPALRGLPELADNLQEGDVVSLSPIDGGTAHDEIEVRGVEERHGPQGERIKTHVELEEI